MSSNGNEEPRSSTTSNANGETWNKSNVPLPLHPSAPRAPKPYRNGLTPLPSNLRPHCHARDRLRLWKPLNAVRDADDPLSEEDRKRISDVLSFGWQSNTAEVYGAGLLVFHASRAPATTLAGSYSEKTLSNYVAGLHAWHVLHGLPCVMLHAARNLAPPASKKPPRIPYTPAFLSKIKLQLNLDDHLDAAVWACALSLFWVQKITNFDPRIHVTPGNVTEKTDAHGATTKSNPDGEEIFWAAHAALTSDHLFSYLEKGRRRPLSRRSFLTHLKSAATAAKEDSLHGHGFRIGGTLEYLVRGVPFDVVKSKGRWASDAFTIYLRRHAQIMAPYMQDNPNMHGDFIRYAMPVMR
ncbi:hypothetical protein BV25DRAFT_1873326 [Artomyces pyxidatus]|uniref:Uncharacterized protein n=1 Tax=Artomyces pyxidatus TaxID=48021 RepID=A0ACB8SEP4_9AGAM|nr:hypothetical protein BV25DRAFT_1873326 [Artomyces pyxidatus]